MHLIGNDRRTRRRFHVDMRNGQRGHRHDISMRLALRRAWPTVPGFAKIRQRLERAHRHEPHIARCPFPNRRFRRRDVDDYPMRPTEAPVGASGSYSVTTMLLVPGGTCATRCEARRCRHGIQIRCTPEHSRTDRHDRDRQPLPSADQQTQLRARLRKYRGADTRSQKNTQSHGGILREVRCDVSHDRIDTRYAVHATIVDADSRLRFIHESHQGRAHPIACATACATHPRFIVNSAVGRRTT